MQSVHTYSFPVHSSSITSSNATVVAIVGMACELGGGTAMRASSSQSASMAAAAFPRCSPKFLISSICVQLLKSTAFPWRNDGESWHRSGNENAIAGKLEEGIKSGRAQARLSAINLR